MIEAVTGVTLEKPAFDAATLAFLDGCQRLLSPSEVLGVARTIALDLDPAGEPQADAEGEGEQAQTDGTVAADATLEADAAAAAAEDGGDSARAAAAARAATTSSLLVMPKNSLLNMTFTYLTGIATPLWRNLRDPRLAAINTAGEVADHAAFVRAKVLEKMGGLPQPSSSLGVKITGTLDRDGYQVDKLTYQSQDGFYVTANLYRPKTGSAPYPTVVGIPGHASDGTSKAYDVYQRVFIALAKRGFLVFVIDPFGQGERAEEGKPGSGSSEHNDAGIRMYLTGTNPLRWMIFDVMRGVDYLLSRPDVDAKRLAVIGNSGGGAQTNFVAAIDSRFDAAGPSCGAYSEEAMWSSNGGLNDAEQNLFGYIEDGLSHADLYAGFATKPVKIFAGTQDRNPTKGSREAFADIRDHFYQPLGQPQNVEYFESNDGHGWLLPRREATVEWLEKIFNNRIVDYKEPDPFPTETAKSLWATPNGSVYGAGGPGGSKTQALNYAIAQKLYASRAALTTGDLPGLVRSRLEMGSWSGLPSATAKGTVSGTGYTIEKVALSTEAGITVPGLVFKPSGGSGQRPGVLYLNNLGKGADASGTGPLAAIARSGRVVLAIDARQWGESAYPACKGDNCKNFTMAQRTLLIGRNLVGMQTRDALRALDYLASRSDVDAASLAVIGKSNAGVTLCSRPSSTAG